MNKESKERYNAQLLNIFITMCINGRNALDDETLKEILKRNFGKKVRFRQFLKLVNIRKRKLKEALILVNNFENLTEEGLVYKELCHGGLHYLYKFGTDGISLIRHEYSYGGKEGFYEKIDVKYDSEDMENLNHNLLSQTVEGWLTVDEVNKIIFEKKERYNSRNVGTV